MTAREEIKDLEARLAAYKSLTGSEGGESWWPFIIMKGMSV